ncbi:MAG: hypothetical protein OXC37_02355 [Bdellovibrionaceae bacterium]|nr:hypothetical protein [Pseudobdellovibrionaceae bacterium]
MKMSILGIVTIISLSSCVQAKHFWRGDLMSIKKVCKKWGNNILDVSKFKSVAGNKDEEAIRAKMTCSLIKNQKQYIGKNTLEIRKSFGNYTGHYFSDIYPTYIIQTAKTNKQNTWQIVFFIDRKRKVSKIVVHKNCCDN